MFHVIATIHIVPGERDAFLSAFRELVPKIRSERGCLEYVPTLDVEAGISAQPEIRTDAVTVIEKWQDLDALRNHLAAPNLGEFVDKMKKQVAGLEIRVFSP